jgi:uncharacterized protein (TIGR04222 family)
MNSRTPATLLAAPGDTWGIPSHTFLMIYLVAAAVLVVLAVYAVVSGFTGRTDAPTTQLSPEEVGYLAGGRRQAYLTALAALRAQGLVTGAGTGRIIATPRYGQPLSELQQAILEASAGGARTSAVLTDLRVKAALDHLRTTLQQYGLLASQGRMRMARLLPRLVKLLLLIGILRFAFGFMSGRPVRDLFLTMVVLALVGVIVRFAGRTRTPAGSQLIRNLRTENEHLRESANPSWATYGAMGAGMSVALFGATSMFAFDPVFAAEAAIPRYAGSSGFGGGDSSGGSGWSEGGSSWGGGSDGGGGGDSGGGSSCGGGGGCGG